MPSLTHRLKIWESHGKPHHYQMTAKYYSKPRDSQPAIHRFPEETPALFDPVFAHFKRFFRKKTRIDWDERLAKVGSQPKKYWQYKPPVSPSPLFFFFSLVFSYQACVFISHCFASPCVPTTEGPLV